MTCLTKRGGRVLAIPVAAMLLMGSAYAHSHKLKKLEIVHPWCVETQAGTTTVAVYMTVRNSAKRGDRLLRATSSIADKAELRAGEAANAIASFDANAGGELILKRGGAHILLTGVKKPLDPYGAFFMTLVFERAGKVEVEVQVEEASILAPPKH